MKEPEHRINVATLEKIRISMGLNKSAFAKYLGTSHAHYSQLCTGHRRGLFKVHRFAKKLQLPVEDLITREEFTLLPNEKIAINKNIQQKQITEKVKELFENGPYNQTELASIIGMNGGQLSKCLNGKLPWPKSRLEKIYEVYGANATFEKVFGKEEIAVFRERNEEEDIATFVKRSNFYRLLVKTGFSINELSKRYGCTRSYMYQLLNGKVGIGADALEKLAKILDVEQGEFLRPVSSPTNEDNSHLLTQDETNKKTAGEILKTMRKIIGLSQSGLAKAAGLRYGTIIWTFENNRRNIGRKTANKIAPVLGLPVDEFERILLGDEVLLKQFCSKYSGDKMDKEESENEEELSSVEMSRPHRIFFKLTLLNKMETNPDNPKFVTLENLLDSYLAEQ